MKTWVGIGLIFGFASSLCAQQKPSATPRPTPPPGPLIDHAPEFAQWTITIKAGTGTAAAPSPGASPSGTSPAPNPANGQKSTPAPTDREILVMKTGTIRFEQTKVVGAVKSQKWSLPDIQVILQGTAAPVVVMPGAGSAFTDHSKTDFDGFEWISARNYTGIDKVMGIDCLVFRGKTKLNSDAFDPGVNVSAVACVSLNGRQPVALQAGDEVRTYQFGSAPTDMLALPPPVQKLVDQWRTKMRQAALLPSKP